MIKAIILLMTLFSALSLFGNEWQTIVLDGSSLDPCTEADHVNVVQGAGPDGGAAIVFDNDAGSTGYLEVDLAKLGIDPAGYDQLRFDLYLENALVNIHTVLWGWSDDETVRSWYFKREPRINAWDHVVYSLELDDDGSDNHHTGPRRLLAFRFQADKNYPLPAGERAIARIANVRLVTAPVTLTLDPSQVRLAERDGAWAMHHPLVLRNQTDKPLTARLEVLPETLAAFTPDPAVKSVSLSPAGSVTVTMTLRCTAEAAEKLPPGIVERAGIVAIVPELSGFRAVTVRGYRPQDLFGMTPPRLSRDWRNLVSEIEPSRMEKLRTRLDWRYAAQDVSVLPRYSDHFRCKTCKFRLDARNLTTYYCHNKECTAFQQEFTVTQEEPLFASYLGIYHTQNAELARDLAAAHVQSGDPAFAETAIRILTTYANVLPDLPMVSALSTGYHSRLTSAVLFEKEILEPFAEAVLLLQHLDDLPQELVRRDLLTPLLHEVNLHYYGTSAGQVGILKAQFKAAIAADQPWYLADALGGDAGVQTILARTFTRDGIGVEGGAYALVAADRIGDLADFLASVGVQLDRERLAKIKRHTSAMFDRREPEDSLVLPDTGLTILVTGDGEGRRKLTVNWGSSRGRAEYDQLSYEVDDLHGPLIDQVGRIAYGNEMSFLMYTTLAHNVPVVDEQNITVEPLRQLAFLSKDSFAACLLSDSEATPAYPGVRLQRAFVQSGPYLLVLDRIQSVRPVTVDLPFYVSGALELKEPASPRPEALGESDAYRLVHDMRQTGSLERVQATWSGAGKLPSTAEVTVVSSMPFAAIAGRIPAGWTGKIRDLLVVRQQLHGVVTTATLYTIWRGADAPGTARVAADAPGTARVAADGDGWLLELPETTYHIAIAPDSPTPLLIMPR